MESQIDNILNRVCEVLTPEEQERFVSEMENRIKLHKAGFEVVDKREDGFTLRIKDGFEAAIYNDIKDICLKGTISEKLKQFFD